MYVECHWNNNWFFLYTDNRIYLFVCVCLFTCWRYMSLFSLLVWRLFYVGASQYYCVSLILVLICYATTQLATQLRQRCVQVMHSHGNKEARKRLTESNGTPAMDLAQIVLFLCFVLWLLFWSRHSHTQIYEQKMNRTKHTWTMADLFWMGINLMIFGHFIWEILG